jgi:carbon monoxide dehydrogenase subunit G
MELKHRFKVPATVDDTWSVFTDIRTVAGCFPGAVVESVTDDEFDGSVKIKMGPIAMQYKGTGRVVKRDEAARCVAIHARGKDRRGQGSADATITTVLAEDGAGTVVDVTTELAITGKPAQFGRGMIEDVSDKFLGQFVDALSERLATRSSGSPPDSGGGPSGPAAADPPPRAGEIDFFSALLPVIGRRYAPAFAVAVIAVLLLTLRAGRRRV